MTCGSAITWHGSGTRWRLKSVFQKPQIGTAERVRSHAETIEGR